MTSRITNNTNLTENATHDLMILNFPEGFPVGTVNLSFGTSPKRITGVQKVAQTFLRMLLTNASSDVLHSAYGTAFPQFTAAYNLQANEGTDAHALVQNSVTEAESNTKSVLNTPGTDLSSQLESAQIINIEQVGETTTVQIAILTKSGDTAPIALPFTSLGIEVNA